MKAMRELGEKKSQVHIFTGDGRGQNTEILDGILRHIEIQRNKKCGLSGKRFTSLGKLNQASVWWRIGNVVPAFIVAFVLLDAVEIEVGVQKVLRGLPERT